MYKSKRQKNKSFDWYGLSQRFSIRKYHFGAASVLLGTALILGAAQTTAKAEEATTENKTEAVTPTSKDAEAAATPANVTLPATEATTGAPVLDKKELSEEEIAKLAAEVSKKDEKASETATAEKTEVSDKEKATLTAPSTDKKVDKTVDEKADKKDEKKAENPITATKKILEQLTSEAEVLNTTAANYAEKKVEDKSSKEAIAAAVAAAKVEIAASKKVLNEKDVTAEQLNLQLQRISTAIEAVYATMKRAGHNGKIEGLLDGTATTTTGARNNPPKELTVIQNPMALDEEEVLTIIKNVRNANPGLTFDDEIIVSKTGANGNAGGVTIKYADGSPSVTFESGRVVTSTAGAKNLEQLSDSINWFDFATAKITYTDGSTASRVKYLDTPINKTLTAATGSTGRTFSGKFTMYREVTLGKDYVVDGFTYVKGTKINSTEDAFLKMGIAKYEQHLYHDGKTQNGGEIYEALQEGMRFNVPTKVEGYNLVATVAKLGPKDVKTNVGKDKGYTGNTLRYDTKHPTGQIIKDDKTGEVNNLSKIVNGPDGGGRGVDVLLTTINKDYSYLDKAGISTAHREFRDDDSDFKPTGEKREGLVAFTSSRDNSNFGVTLSVGATFNGVPVAVNAIVADGDESGNREFSQFETDGTNWSELMELHWDNRQVDANKRVVEAANGNLVVTDKNGNVYLDSKGNPIIINRTKQLQEEKVQEGANSYTRYYLTSADGYKVVVSEKNKALALDDSGNPYVYDKTGAVSTTTKEGMFKELSDGNRQLVDAEGRDIYLGFNHATAGLETIVLPAGVTNPEFVSDTPEDTRNGWKKTKLYGTVNGVRQEITKDAYGHSLVGSSGYLFEEWTPGNRDKGMVFEKLTKNPPRVANAGDIGDFSRYGYNPNEWATTSEVYGSKLFGSNITAFSSKNRLPIALSQDVKNLSFYGNSSSSVSGVIGFIIYDGGDAPASYGSAQHIIGNFNKTVNGREVTATQPFIGNQKADVDFRTSVNEPSGAWTLDDLVHSEKYHEMSIGAEAANDSERKRVINQKGEEGVFLITSSGNAVIRKDNGEQIAVKQGEILTAMDERTGTPVTGVYNHATRMLGLGSLPDEGLDQLVDPEALDDNGEKIGRKEYTLRQASDTEYVLYGVRANPGQFNEKAYLRGWVDFDGNGKFDSYEESELIEVTPDKKTYNIRFKNIPQLLDTSIDKVGIRLRIALPVKNDKGQEDKQLASPTGVEASGEVEDFQTHVIHYPRGTRHTTKDYQGVEQKIKIPTNAMFIANGKSRESNYQNWVQINNTSLSPKIVLTDKIVASEEAVADANLPELPSNYRKGADGTIFVEKNDVTVYSGKFVTVKDAKGNLLGTALKVVNPNNNKTEYLMTEYNEYDKVGNKVGTYKINPENKGANKLTDANYYETTVTFKPELGYVGTATGIAIRAWDDNNSSTGWEATPETIAASNNQPNLADKDRINGNVNENVNKAKSMDTVYIPTVIDIKPVGKDETTIDEQGKKQKASPKIPDHGTVESINNETIDGARIDKAHVLIDKSKPIEFSTVQAIPGKVYTEDTKVTEETVVTYEDGGTATFKPVDKLPAGTVVFDQNKAYTVTGTGNITVNKVNYGGGTVPKGAILTGSEPTAPIDITVNRNGSEVVVPKGEKLKKGDVLVTPLPVQGGTQRTEWTMTYHTGDTIPGKRTSTDVTLANEITIDQLLKDKGDSITFNGVTYTNNNDVIPKGTISHGAAVDLMNVKLPKATHVNPQTGEVTTVARRYTKVTANEIVIENEGTYTLVPKTTTNEKGETVYEDATVVFTPHPSFVGVGTGVTLRQPDVDYPTVADPDKVTRRYGTDYGYAKYTPTVTPNLTATITRKIHYVYEGDTSTAAKDKTPILTIDGKPVTNEQTLTYNRDYIVMSQDGQTEKDITVASAMTLESPITVVRKGDQVVKEATTVTKLKAGDVVKAGTQLPAGTVIVGAWKAINPENDHFTDIISPTLKGYTAEVQLPEGEYTKSEKNGVQSHVRSSNQTPVGVYTPTIKDGKVNTQDVGAYEPMVSAVRADNKDDFDVYVYYKADKQVARVVYIDMDAANNADQGVLETHTGSTLEANKSATDTITKDETLYGDSATRIKYSTAATIAKYEAMGYELKRDGFTNDDDGNRIVGGRKFDEESVADSVNAGEKAQNQTFYVFLGHKRDTGAKTERADVTRTINYKYKKDGSKAAESVTETLNFTRNITIDMALAAAAFPEDTATFNAENTKATPEEKQAAQAKYAEVEKQYNAAAEKVKEDSTTAQALATADKDVTTTEKALADAKKANNSLVITSESTQAQKDAKAVVEAALQAAQTAYDNALAARNTARTNYLAAANSDLAKAVITTQKALEAENAKVAAAKAEYEAKVKDNNASDADKNAALTKFTDAIALAKTAAVNATAAQKAFTDAKDEKEALNDAKVAEAVKNQAIQDRANTTQAAKEAARQAYYDAVIAKVKEESKKETPDKNKVAAVSFGEWKALGSSATNLPTNEQLSEAEKQSDNAFNHVTSPTITGYLADKVAIDKTDAIDPLADDYEVDVFYEQGEQRAIVKFVEVDANNPDTVITPGVAEDLVEIGKTGDNFATLNTAAVKAAIKKLEDKGYTLVSDGFENPGTGVSNTTFDNDPKKDQEFVVKVKAKVVDIPSFDPTKPVSNDNPKPTPGVIPIDPSNPSGPKWTEDLIKAVKVQEEVTRTIKYVYEDGTEVPADKLADVADKKVKTLKFTRPGKINVVTGEITYGDWSADQTFDAVTSPIIENYIAAVAGVTPTTANVPAKTVTATDKDFEEVVVYKKAKPVTITPDAKVPDPEDPNTPADNPIQPNKPIDPNNPEGPKWTKELIDKLRAAREETVTRTITYKYSTETSELKAEDAAKAGQTAADTVTNSVTFKRPVTIDPVTKEFTYGDWVADNNDTTLEGKADLPVVAGYVATGDVEGSKKDVTDVKATDKDITENVVYKTVGKYVPVIPDGITPPANTNVDPKPYNNDPQDGSKVKDPDPTNPVVPGTTTPIVPQIPGTTPVGPDGKPLKPVDSNDLSKGYVPPTPTDPTKDTSIIYVKDGSQVAVVHFVDEKGNSVNESVVETGDTGNTISTTKADAVKKALEAKGYEVVAPTDALYTADKEGFYKEADRKFDAVSDKATGAADEKVPSQQYYVIVKAKDLPVDPMKPVDPNNNPVDPTNPTPENPTKPRDPETPVTPKPEDKVPNDPKGRTYGELGLVEQVTRTINYVKNDGSKAAEPVKETLTFTRKAKINAVTGEVTYLAADGVTASTKEDAPWTPVNGDKFTEKVSPAVPNYTPTVEKVAEKTGVTATDEDIVETVVYNPTKQTVDPNAPKDPSTPDVTPKPNDVVPNDPKGRTYKELGLIEEVTRTVHYVYEDGTKAAEDKVQTITFTRTAEIDTVTGAISNFGTWTLKDENNTFEPETTEAKAGYVASAAKSTEVTGVQATDKDTEETIIYRKLGSYVPVVPAGVTPPANFDKTPKPYPNATPEDPTRPGTPTTPTTTIPEIPGTTPVGPDGTPLTKNPNGGYDLPPVPTDPTQNTTITYVKDGSQVAVVHFVDEKGNSVNESVVETGDTGKEISKSNVDSIKAKLEAKGYTVVEPTDALYTTDKEGFYKEATRTFDAVSDKSTGTAGEKVPSQQYYVIVKAKDLPVDPTKPLDPNNNPVDPTNPTPENPTKPRDPETPVTPKPEDKVPNDPKGRTYGELGLVEQVTRTINYVKNDGSKAADPVKETLTFTRKAKINAVTGEVTYLDNDGNATTKEAAPWTPVNNDTTFDKVTSPSVPDYTPTKAEVPAKENVTATDEDIVETVVYNPTKVTVTPNDPNVDPEKPLNPNDPNGLKYKDLKLTEEVKRTITYTYADDVADTTKRGTDAAPKHETTVSFTRTATVNQATGEVTYGDWTAVNNDTTLEGKTELPVITGYVATGDVESSKKDVANVTATDKDIVEKVVYKDLGKYVPVVPEGTTPPTITDPKYPNNPTDPTKPGEPTTTIPNVPGLTPLDPSTGKPLEPKDPNDLTKGYKPPVPQDPSKDTNIVYVKDGSQVTVVHFVDEDGNAVHTSFVEAGDAGAKFTKAGEVTKVVEELKAAGYTVVPNKAGQAEYPGEAGVFDSVDDKGKDGVSQVYYVTVAKTVPVTPTNPENPNEDPKNPKPGDPIDPNKPDGPKWTEDALNKLNNIKSVTRTITYVKAGTDEEVSPTTAPKVTDKVSFTRTAIVNPKDGSLVGYDTNGDGKADVPATDTDSGWKAVNDDTTFDKVTSPVVPGYVLKNAAQKEVAATTGLTPKSDNENIKVEYVPVGTWTPKVPDGETPIDPIPYPNDPTDPGKVVDPNDPTTPNDPNKPSVPVIPHIPGTTPKDPNGNPLKPVDPADPSKGYVPPTPKTPTENTVIEYVKDTQKATVKYVVAGTNTVLHTDELEGKSGEPINYSTATKLAELKELGYDLVTDGFTTATDKNYDKDTKVDQSFVVTVTPHVEPIKPFDPTNPNDPNTPKPGQPIDPNNPDGPKWTEELINKLETTKHVTRKITYVEDGTDKEVADKATDKVTFTREAKINVVTGTIEYGKWTPVNNDTTFDKVTSPVVPGYVLKDPAQKEVAETTGLTENSKDETIKVVYVPVGRLVPKVPEGVTPPTPTPYDNDPQDPGKVVPPSPTKPTDPQDPNSPKVPVIPHIPGTTPKVPQDPTKPVDPNTNPLVPLKPVDPKDPSKGYEVPPVPTNPGTDTPIVYENDKQKAITNFVDNNGKVVSDPVVDYGESGSKFTKSGDVESKIKELVKKGYVVTSNDYPSADTDRVFDNDKDKDQIFNVKVTPLIVPTDPNSPDQPQVPTDPTKPVGPNNPLKPVTPSTPEPGKPVFPEDPNSPVWPETVKDMVTETTATRTITYVDRNGKEVAATHTETIKFKRTAKVNLVTGDITYGEWIVVGNDTILDGNKLPKVDGYIARGGDIESSQKDIKATAGVNITERVVYDKLGSWIPKLPEGQTQVPPTPYPNDPTDPTKPGTDRPRVPYVPGFIPVDPNGNPLKPVDPNDPTKGYEVPVVPADPTQDTPIKYIPVPKPNNGGGNNGGGGGNTPTPQPQPNPTPQPEPSPAPNPVPVTPETPEQPVVPVAPEQPAEPATPQYMDGQRELPNTGTEAHSSLAALGLLGALSGFGLIARKKREDEE